MEFFLVNAQYLSIELKKIKEVIKVSKKVFSLVSETLYPFFKTLAAEIVNLLSERQNV